MRVEPRDIGSVVHVLQRGTRGVEIVRDEWDHNRFSKLLFYLNDSFTDTNWNASLKTCEPYERPAQWPERDPLTRILAWTLLQNHFHLLLEETREGGIAKFMQRLCGSMTLTFNLKYEERGSLFQGSYKSRTVDTDEYLRYLTYYIQVKNTLEAYPGGLPAALKDFDAAWNWAIQYPYSSLNVYATNVISPILDIERFSEICETRLSKVEAFEMLTIHMQSHNDKYRQVALESW